MTTFSVLEGAGRTLKGRELHQDLHQTAIYQVDKMMLTDAPLLYTPGQLALAALHKPNDLHRVLNFERYLESVFSRQHSDCPVEQFVQSIHTINYLDGNALRTKFLVEMLKYKDNESKDNIPEDIQELIKRVRI